MPSQQLWNTTNLCSYFPWPSGSLRVPYWTRPNSGMSSGYSYMMICHRIELRLLVPMMQNFFSFLAAGVLGSTFSSEQRIAGWELLVEDPYVSPMVARERLGPAVSVLVSLFRPTSVPVWLHEALLSLSVPLDAAVVAELATMAPPDSDLSSLAVLGPVARKWTSFCIMPLRRNDPLPPCSRRGDHVALRDDWMQILFAMSALRMRAEIGLVSPHPLTVTNRLPADLSFLPAGVAATVTHVVLNALSQEVYATDALIQASATAHGLSFPPEASRAVREKLLVETTFPLSVLQEVRRMHAAGASSYASITHSTGAYADYALLQTMLPRWIRVCAVGSCRQRGAASFMSEATARRYFARRLRASSGCGPVLQGMTREERRSVMDAVLESLASTVPAPSVGVMAERMGRKGFVLGNDELAAVVEKLIRLTTATTGPDRRTSALASVWQRVCSLDASNCVRQSDGQLQLTPTGIQAMFRWLHENRPTGRANPVLSD